MNGIAHSVLHVTSALACVVLVALLGFTISPALAAINLTGDVIPSPPMGDPWNVGDPLSVGDTLNGSMSVDSGSESWMRPITSCGVRPMVLKQATTCGAHTLARLSAAEAASQKT